MSSLVSREGYCEHGVRESRTLASVLRYVTFRTDAAYFTVCYGIFGVEVLRLIYFDVRQRNEKTEVRR